MAPHSHAKEVARSAWKRWAYLPVNARPVRKRKMVDSSASAFANVFRPWHSRPSEGLQRTSESVDACEVRSRVCQCSPQVEMAALCDVARQGRWILHPRSVGAKALRAWPRPKRWGHQCFCFASARSPINDQIRSGQRLCLPSPHQPPNPIITVSPYHRRVLDRAR